MQQAFLERDAFQCGYCTPGQICSALGMLGEAALGEPSEATDDLTAPALLTDAEIRERMSGNLCRCSAYPQILDAIRDVAGPAA
jgi:xanthine dehydrogenase YagT iron-sulfur-binding subunit